MIIYAGGKDRLLRYGYKALKESATIVEKDPDLQTRNGGLDFVEMQMFLAFKYGAIQKKEKVDFKMSDIELWLDEDLSLLDKITEFVMNESGLNEKKKKGQK